MFNWLDLDSFQMFIYQEQSFQWSKVTLDFNLNKHYTSLTNPMSRYLFNGEHFLQKSKKNLKNSYFINNSNNKKQNN